MRCVTRRLLFCALLLGLLPACQHRPEWRRRAEVLLRDPRFPRSADKVPACLTDALLADGIRAAVASVGFSEVTDFGPLYGAGCSSGPSTPAGPPAPCAALVGRTGTQHFPQIDLAVIACNRPGCPLPLAKATAVFDRAHPEGFVATHDPKTLAITNIRFRKWNESRWNGGHWLLEGEGETAQARILPGTEKAWDAPDDEEDQLGTAPTPDAGQRSLDFMSPWPASVFKMRVAAYVSKLLTMPGSRCGSNRHARKLSVPVG